MDPAQIRELCAHGIDPSPSGRLRRNLPNSCVLPPALLLSALKALKSLKYLRRFATYSMSHAYVTGGLLVGLVALWPRGGRWSLFWTHKTIGRAVRIIAKILRYCGYCGGREHQASSGLQRQLSPPPRCQARLGPAMQSILPSRISNCANAISAMSMTPAALHPAQTPPNQSGSGLAEIGYDPQCCILLPTVHSAAEMSRSEPEQRHDKG